MTKQEKFLEEVMSTFWGNKHPPERHEVSHYTSIENAKSIISSNELWLNHYTMQKDSSEITYGAKFFCTFLTHNARELASDEKQRMFLVNSAKAMQRYIDDDFISELHFYVVSFCKKADYLPAWREYGDGCQGAALKFQIPNDFFTDKKFEIGDVYYDQTDVQIFFGDFIKTFITISVKYFGDTFFSGEEHQIDLMAMLCYLIPYIKHAAYAEEHETRIIFKSVGKPDCNLMPNGTVDCIKSIGLPSNCIRAVKLGPLAAQKNASQHSWECFLRDEFDPDGKIEVTSSDIPVRT